MLRMLVTFAPVAALLTVTPGVGTAMVVRSAAEAGRRHAVLTTIGHSAGILVWACLAAAGVAAVVAASAAAFTAVKLAGAAFLIAIGVRSLLRLRDEPATARPALPRTALVAGPWLRRVERLTGAVLVALGVRLALERR